MMLMLYTICLETFGGIYVLMNCLPIFYRRIYLYFDWTPFCKAFWDTLYSTTEPVGNKYARKGV